MAQCFLRGEVRGVRGEVVVSEGRGGVVPEGKDAMVLQRSGMVFERRGTVPKTREMGRYLRRGVEWYPRGKVEWYPMGKVE